MNELLSPDQRPAPTNPLAECEAANLVADTIENGQAAFLRAAQERGVQGDDLSALVRDAIVAGAIPPLIVDHPFRGPDREAFILHGAIPEGFIGVRMSDARATAIRGNGDPEEWPTAPSANDPEAFYVERISVTAPVNFDVDQFDVNAGYYDTEEDAQVAAVQSAARWRSVADRLAVMLPDRTQA